MEFVLVAGTEHTAPISANGVPPGPTWAGKRLQQLSKDELDDMLAYCMKEGRRLGYVDTMECRPVRSPSIGDKHHGYHRSERRTR